MRREQARIFETMINVLAMGLQLDPKISTKVENLMNDYIDVVIPGTKKQKIEDDKAFAQRTANALNDIAALLSGSNNGVIKKNSGV